MVGLAIPGMSHYIATKMGIIGFMRGLANDVARNVSLRIQYCLVSRTHWQSHPSRKIKSETPGTSRRLGGWEKLGMLQCSALFDER
jgi:hypothetical protein